MSDITNTDSIGTGPCGCFACEKWADCDYCGECSGRDPWAAAANERREQAEWDRAHEGSLADWLYESDADALVRH